MIFSTKSNISLSAAYVRSGVAPEETLTSGPALEKTFRFVVGCGRERVIERRGLTLVIVR